MISRLEHWWRALDDGARVRWTVVGWLIALHLLGNVLLVPWMIEDAAITFAFAKHAALGEGFVAYPGGERVEGFSNPSWTLILTALRLVGISPFIAAKLLGALLGACTLALTCRIGELWFGRRGLWAVAPVALLAVDPQHIIWNASGLENSLVVAMLAAGTLVALDDEAPSWSALALGVLAMTRPEAPLYAAVLGGMGIFRVASERGPGAALRWGLTRGAIALAPWLAWEAFSYAYFAWPFPNTYYAKLADGEVPEPWMWSHRGWGYLRGWSLERGTVALLPLLILGQTGTEGWRRWAGLGAGLLTWVLLVPGMSTLSSYWTEPVLLGQVRVAWFFALGVFLPLAGQDREGSVRRALAWWLLVAVVAFVLVSSGDWMVGHRWLSFAALPLALLVADAVHAIVRAVPPQQAVRVATGLLTVPAAWGIVDYIGFLNNAETTPWDISRRIAYIQGVQDRLQLDDMVYVEVDFGGTMWWSGDELVDLAGLNDVPIAHHAWEPEFFGEYLYDERRPHVMHAHGNWAARTGIRKHDGWRDYIEIPGYPSSRRRFHVGNLIRRDLVEWEPTIKGPNTASFEDALHVKWRLGAPLSAPGEALHVELAWSTHRRPQHRFRAVFVLTDTVRTLSWELPPAYDWVPTMSWSPQKQYVSRHTLPLPDDLAVGTYDVAIVVLDGRDGEVRPTTKPKGRPHYAKGEARWDAAVEIADRSVADRQARSTMKQAREQATAGECEEAETLLLESRHTLHPDNWRPHEDPSVVEAMARCWAWRSESTERPESVEAIRRARQWSHRDSEVTRTGAALADQWVASGDTALARDDLERAHRAWSDAMIADPTRAWLRRRIEAWRDVRIGLTDERPVDEAWR